MLSLLNSFVHSNFAAELKSYRERFFFLAARAIENTQKKLQARDERDSQRQVENCWRENQ